MTRRLITAILAIVVPGSAGAANAETVAELTRVRAAAELPAELGLLGIDIPPSIAGLEVEPGAVSIEWRRAPRPGSLSVRLSVRLGDETHHSWARLSIGERAEVVVVARALSAGGSVALGDLRLERRTVAAGSGWRLSPRALVGAAVLADARAGELVDGAVVAEPAPVARGSAIDVQIRSGRMIVSTRGILERRARPGAAARVRLTSTRRVVAVRLLDSRTAVFEGRVR